MQGSLAKLLETMLNSPMTIFARIIRTAAPVRNFRDPIHSMAKVGE